MFAYCFHASWTKFVHLSERDFFSLNCSKIAVECNWISKISQNVPISGFLEKKRDGFLSKKNLDFFKTAKSGEIFVEGYQMVFSPRIVFLPYLWGFPG